MAASQGYAGLLRLPGVTAVVASQLTARLPQGMISIAVLLHVQRATGSYAAAGLVLAATSAGQAVTGPVASSLMGRWGTRRVLSVMLAGSAAAFLALSVDTLTLPLYVVLGALAGLLTPPVQSAARTIYPRLVPAHQLTSLYALDASLQEIIWIIAPVLITLVAVQAGTAAAILTIVGVLIGGGVWFVLTPQVGKIRIPRNTRRFGRALRPLVLLVTVVGFLLVAAGAAAETAVVATFGHSGLDVGVMLALLSIGSLVGGLVVGRLRLSPWSMARRATVVTAGLVVATLSTDPVILGSALFITGLGTAPTFAVLYAMTSASVRYTETAEAFGWLGTGLFTGAAAGSALAGLSIDLAGLSGGYLTAVSFALAGTLTAALFSRTLPDLRGRDPQPLPETEPITTPRR